MRSKYVFNDLCQDILTFAVVSSVDRPALMSLLDLYWTWNRAISGRRA